MKYNPKVVSFERGSSYFHQRAMLNRRENNVLDALELMRRAVETSPENREYRLDLAELYCEMGCHKQSNRLLLDMLSESNAPFECYFGLALNQAGMDDLDGARRLLRLYCKLEPSGMYVQTARRLVQELNLVEAIHATLNRRNLRAARIAERGCDALMEGDGLRAERLLKQSMRYQPEPNKVRAMLSLALMMNKRNDEALEEAENAVNGLPYSVQAQCIASQVFMTLGEEKRAREILLQAMDEHPSGADLMVLTCTLGEHGMHAETAECAKQALQEQPYERRILHIRAVALHNTGTSDDRVAHFWQRILRIDPEDTIAQYYLKACHSNMLSSAAPGYAYEVPEKECRRRMNWLSEQMTDGLDGARKQWREDGQFRQMIQWAALSENEDLRRLGTTVLAAIEDADAESFVRAMLFNKDISDDLRIHITALLRLRGANMQSIFPTEYSDPDHYDHEAEILMKNFLVGERQLLRYASEVLKSEYGINALAALALIWTMYKRFGCVQIDPLTNTETISASLAYCYLKQCGKDVEIDEIAKLFGCSPRKMRYYTKRISAIIENPEEGTNHEDL